MGYQGVVHIAPDETREIDFTGTITGGTGRFEGATGTWTGEALGVVEFMALPRIDLSLEGYLEGTISR